MEELNTTTTEGGVVAEINHREGAKYEVTAKGLHLNPILVSIADERGSIVFEEYVFRPGGFRRTYDLASLKNRNAEIRVHTDDRLLAAMRVFRNREEQLQ